MSNLQAETSDSRQTFVHLTPARVEYVLSLYGKHPNFMLMLSWRLHAVPPQLSLSISRYVFSSA
jgi:hypothetical protein